MESAGQAWGDRGIAERKVLVNAMEGAYVQELLPASYVLLRSGPRQDYPELSLQEAKAVLDRLISDGLVGLYPLDDPAGQLLGRSALARTADAAIWTTPGSCGLCLFLTPSGDRAVGIE